MITTKCPADVSAALLRNAKIWLLNNYFGGKKKLEAYNDHYASLISIHSWSLPGNRKTNLRRLSKLVETGILIEKPRYRVGIGARSFTLPRQQLDDLGAQAVKEWESAGYVVGEMMDEIGAQA